MNTPLKWIAWLTLFCCSSVFSSHESEANAIKAQEQAIKQEGIKVLEKEFSFKYQNDAQLDAFVAQQMTNYYGNLRTCHPGTYKFVVPFVGFIVNTSTIQGFQDNVCVVETHYQMGDQKIENKCHYQRESLTVFTNEEASKTAKGQISYDSTNLTPLQKVQEKECKTFSNGQPLV